MSSIRRYVLPTAALALTGVVLAGPAVTANADGEHDHSEPTKKNETVAQTSAATGAKKSALHAVGAATFFAAALDATGGVRAAHGDLVAPLFAGSLPSTITGIAVRLERVDRDLVKRLNANPSDFYTNLHTSEYPGGAVRGQIFDAAPG